MSSAQTVDTGSHRVTLLAGAEMLYQAVFGDLAAATRTIDIECYIVSSDRMGEELFRAIAAARGRGVQVRVLYDPLGSQHTEDSFFDDLRALDVQVRSYGAAPHLSGAGILGPRDHGRVIVVDGVAYTGGAAWGEQWLPRDRGGRGWHDVCCRVEGPVVEDFRALYEQRWAEAAGTRDLADLDTGQKYPDLALVADTPSRAHSLVYREHDAAFRRARSRIWIANAYFYPPPEMIDALTDAAARGVDVRILVPGESDLPIIERAARAEYKTWLDDGLLVYEYASSVMHAKYAVVDDDWGTVGTFNANPTSVGLANEVNLFFRDRAFIARLAAQYERDLSSSDPVLASDLAHRPIAQRVADRLAATVFDAANLIWGPR
jgi:cardiolipin synthase A/B